MSQFKGKAFGYLRGKNEVVSLGNELRMYNKKINSLNDAYDAVANTGLLVYPLLMIADVILYDAKFVPVGHDQLQHLELARTIVRKFNKRFNKTFVEPQPLLTNAPRIMDLRTPDKKMSKSEPAGCLFMDDSPTVIREKIKRAVTDSGKDIKYDPNNKPAISNLITIYGGILEVTTQEVEQKFSGASYVEFKKDVAETIIKELAPFQKKKQELQKKTSAVKKVFVTGSQKAEKIASQKLNEVKQKIGLAL